MINVAPYRKFVVALAAALGVLGAGVADGSLTGPETIAVVSAFLGSLGVFGFSNDPA